MTWMIYGAAGYTGRLLTAEAVKRGHRPVLAGRSEWKLSPLAERYGLDRVVVSLDDETALARAVAGVELVFHAAGPFTHTSRPMVWACLAARTHYLDITGELSVLEQTLAQDEAARQQQVVLISGAGFDVVPTDCLARFVAGQIPGATKLETAIATHSRPTAGTARSALEILPGGVRVRREGNLVSLPWGYGARRISFPSGERTVLPAPWGDVVTAYRTTGIPNITSYLAYPALIRPLLPWLAPLGQELITMKAFRRLAQGLAGVLAQGPGETKDQTGRSYLWARAAGPGGETAEAWLETLEPYQFTAVAGVRCVEKTLAERPSGALTPALAFGADFVLELEGTQRLP